MKKQKVSIVINESQLNDDIDLIFGCMDEIRNNGIRRAMNEGWEPSVYDDHLEFVKDFGSYRIGIESTGKINVYSRDNDWLCAVDSDKVQLLNGILDNLIVLETLGSEENDIDI